MISQIGYNWDIHWLKICLRELFLSDNIDRNIGIPRVKSSWFHTHQVNRIYFVDNKSNRYLLNSLAEVHKPFHGIYFYLANYPGIYL